MEGVIKAKKGHVTYYYANFCIDMLNLELEMVAASTVPIFLYFILMWFYLGRCINVIDKPGLLAKSTLRLEIVVMLLILITFSFCCRWSCILQIKEKSYVALKPYI